MGLLYFLEIDRLMEGLAISRVIPVFALSRRNHSTFLPGIPIQLQRTFYRGQVRMMMNHPRPLNLASSSVQPLGAWPTGHFDNTLPCKGHNLYLEFFNLFVKALMLKKKNSRLGYLLND